MPLLHARSQSTLWFIAALDECDKKLNCICCCENTGLMSHAFNSLADCFWNSCRKDAKSKPPTPWRRDGSSLSLSSSMHLAPIQVSVTSMVPQTRDPRKINGRFASRWRKLQSSASHQRKKAKEKKRILYRFLQAGHPVLTHEEMQNNKAINRQ